MKKPNKKKPKSTKAKPGKKTQFSTLPSVRMQIKGKVLGNPVDENKDIINYTGPLFNDALFIECREWAIREYNKVVDPLSRRGQKFVEGPKKPRQKTGMANLGEVIKQAYADFEKQNGYKPGAKGLSRDIEFWNFLKSSRYVDRGNGPILDMTKLERVSGKWEGSIEFLDAKGCAKESKFKTFHNILAIILPTKTPLKK